MDDLGCLMTILSGMQTIRNNFNMVLYSRIYITEVSQYQCLSQFKKKINIYSAVPMRLE